MPIAPSIWRRPRLQTLAFALAAALCAVPGPAFAGLPRARKVAVPPEDVPEGPAIPVLAYAPPDLPPQPIPLAITVSGAVSLGAWQAGFLYYLSECVKRNPELLDIQLITGASAGTINALLTILEAGSPPTASPEQSLLWSLWTTKTYDEFFDVAQADGPYLSSGAVLEDLAEDVKERWLEGLPEGFDLVLGSAVTREKPRMVDLGGGLTVPRNQEHFVLRVRGRGPDKVPAIENYIDQDEPFPELLLPVHGASAGDADIRDFDVLVQMLFASSAVPGAFAPRTIDYCVTPLAPGADCSVGAVSARFMDAAMSDRHPLRLAWRVADMGLARGPGGGIYWRHKPDAGARALPDDLLFLYIDPTHTSYPPLPTPEGIPNGGSQDRIMASLASLVGDLAGSAQAAELYNLAEEHPELSARLALVEPALPPVSGELFKFFGFFDRRFRKYDFYLGMADAHRFIERVLRPRVRARFGDSAVLVSPEPSDPQQSWRPYACVRAVVDGFGDAQLACAEERDGGYEVLLQTSVDRLWDHCRALPGDTETDHALCAAAIHGAPRPRVPNVEPLEEAKAWRRRREGRSLESDFDYLSRLLELYRFAYQDFELSQNKAWLATTYLRGELGGMVTAYGEKLDGRLRWLVLGAGKPALNILHYAPPATTIHLSFGPGIEIGSSSTGRLVPRRWLRLDTALQVQGLGRFLTPRPNMVDITPMVGLGFESQRLSGVILQPRLALRVGYQFSSRDRWGSAECDVARFDDEPLACSVPVGQLLLALRVFERLRFHAGIEYEAGVTLGDPLVQDDGLSALMGVGFQWISPFAAETHRRATLARRRAHEPRESGPEDTAH
ncbi:MAG: patatin-like phospholipase family protein [Pseudomonadota bacterium]